MSKQWKRSEEFYIIEVSETNKDYRIVDQGIDVHYRLHCCLSCSLLAINKYILHRGRPLALIAVIGR